MKKKFLRFCLMFMCCLSIFLLVGCGNNDNTGNEDNTEDNTPEISTETMATFKDFSKIDETTYSYIVSNATEYLNMSDYVSVYETSRWTLNADISANNRIESKIATLEPGDNTYYVLVKAQNEDVKLYTIKIRRKPIYTISFNTNGGGDIEDIEIEEGYCLPNDIENPSKTGYSFVSWDYNFSTPITSNIVISANYTPNIYNVIYHNTKNDTEQIVEVSYNSQYQIKGQTSYSVTGYSHNSWNTQENGMGTTYQFNNTITQFTFLEDLHLYSIWSPINYTISYHYNGGNEINTIKNYNIESDTITLLSTTKEHYEFEGWFTESTFENKVTKIETGATGNLNLYAKFNPISYAIIYHNCDGFENDNLTEYNIESNTITLKSIEKEHYNFNGWYTNETFTGNQVTTIETGSYGNRDLYAKFTPIQYSITYQNAPDTEHNARYYTIESEAIVLNPAPKENYEFKGWFKETTFETPITTIETGTTGNLIIYAKYLPVIYTITYHNCDGLENNNPTELTIESENVILNSIEKAGYEFKGFYGNSNFEGDAITEINKLGCDLDLYAKFTITNYSITYHLETSEENHSNNPMIYNIESETIILNDASKYGYEFGGWYSEGSLENEIEKIEQGSYGNVDLYPKWIMKNISFAVISKTYNEYGEVIDHQEGGELIEYSVKSENSDVFGTKNTFNDEYCNLNIKSIANENYVLAGIFINNEVVENSYQNFDFTFSLFNTGLEDIVVELRFVPMVDFELEVIFFDISNKPTIEYLKTNCNIQSIDFEIIIENIYTGEIYDCSITDSVINTIDCEEIQFEQMGEDYYQYNVTAPLGFRVILRPSSVIKTKIDYQDTNYYMDGWYDISGSLLTHNKIFEVYNIKDNNIKIEGFGVKVRYLDSESSYSNTLMKSLEISDCTEDITLEGINENNFNNNILTLSDGQYKFEGWWVTTQNNSFLISTDFYNTEFYGVDYAVAKFIKINNNYNLSTLNLDSSIVYVAAGGTCSDYETFKNNTYAKGSGFIYSIDSENNLVYIVTTYSVVNGWLDKVYVLLPTREVYNAVVVGYSEQYDIVVLKVSVQNLESISAVTVYDSTNLQIGEKVFVNKNIVTNESYKIATITNINVEIKIGDNTYYSREIELTNLDSRRINVLYNEKGQFIGLVNNYLKTTNNVYKYYAIPGNLVMSIVASIINNNGKATYVDLGVNLSQDDSEPEKVEIEENKFIDDYKVIVSSVRTGSLSYGKISNNDEIISFTFTDIFDKEHTINMYNQYSFEDVMFTIKLGSTIIFDVKRGEETIQVSVVVSSIANAN